MFQQFFTAFVASFGQTLLALINTWPSYTQELLTANDTTILTRPLTEFEIGLIGSVPSLGAMIGTGVAGTILDRFGRKRGGVLIAIPAIVGWSIIGITTSPLVLMIFRFISGITGGASLVFAPVFISETAQESIRGMLATATVLFYVFGVLLSFLFGWFFSYSTIALVNVALGVIAAVICMLVIESPVFLMRQNLDEDARLAIAKYRGLAPTSKTVTDEITRLKQQLMPASELIAIQTKDKIDDKPDTANSDDKEKENLMETEYRNISGDTIKVTPLKTLLMSPPSRRAFFLVLFTLVAQVNMGMISVQVYAKHLFKEAAPDLSPDFCSVILALILVTGAVVSAALTDRAGRRILIITSSAMVGTCWVIMAVLMGTNIAPPLVTVILMLVFSFSFYCGAGCVPFVLLSELFTAEVQGVASMIFVEVNWFCSFLFIAVYPVCVNALGVSGVFYIFASIAFANCIFSFVFLPETKGLTKMEIQKKLATGKR